MASLADCHCIFHLAEFLTLPSIGSFAEAVFWERGTHVAGTSQTVHRAASSSSAGRTVLLLWAARSSPRHVSSKMTGSPVDKRVLVSCFSSSEFLPWALRDIKVKHHDLTSVLKCYHDLGEVFSKSKATSLPPHRPYDCPIDLISGAAIPRGKLYSISGSEEEDMTELIESSLKAGLIRPSSSPAGALSFFVG